MIESNDRLVRGASSYDEGVQQVANGSGDPEVGVTGGCAATLVNDLGWGLGMVFRAYVTAAQAAVADLPGGPRGYQVLAASAQGKVTSQLALAQHLAIDRTVMTYLLDDLERAGLVERRADPADRRARQVLVTETGTRRLVTLDAHLRAAEDHLLAPLREEERQAFRSQLRRLAVPHDVIDPIQNPCELANQVDASIPTPPPSTSGPASSQAKRGRDGCLSVAHRLR